MPARLTSRPANVWAQQGRAIADGIRLKISGMEGNTIWTVFNDVYLTTEFPGQLRIE